MERRRFLNNMALGMGGTVAAGIFSGMGHGATGTFYRPIKGGAKATVTPRGTARNVIFVLLQGGPSHVDTFDLKLGSETPSLLGAQSLGGFQWPAGTMPKLVKHKDTFSVVRSLVASEAVHERGVYHLTTAHRHDASRIKEIPHFASVMSYKLEAQRRAGDSLPSVVVFGGTMAQNGFFPIEHRGLKLNEAGQISNLVSDIEQPDGGPSRYDLLGKLLDRMDGVSDARMDRVRLQRQSRKLMKDTQLQKLLGINEDEGDGEEYSLKNSFRKQCASVMRLLDADKGTRVVQMFLGGWDHHSNIYAPGGALPELSGALDEGLAYLIESLAAKPAKSGIGTMLDETLIVAAGEFGRTTNGLNASGGRDHYPDAMSAFFAGGGVKGGRFIGATNSTGSAVTDRGWSQDRYMGTADLVATLYSAMGLDWSEKFTNTPSGRLYEIVPGNQGPVFDIDPLFV